MHGGSHPLPLGDKAAIMEAPEGEKDGTGWGGELRRELTKLWSFSFGSTGFATPLCQFEREVWSLEEVAVGG